jgi:exosortase A
MPRVSIRWTVPFVACGFAWLCGQVATVNAVSQLGFVGMLVFAVPCVLGENMARRIVFPLAFLFFAVPIGDFLLPTLMQWTADFTVQALRTTGVPVYREGQQFVIPTGRWSVVEACSGIRYLIASLMVGALYAYLRFRSTWRRMAFIGVSVLIPIVANWLRAYMIVMIGHLSNNELAVGVDHLIYGWLFFGVVMFLMFWAGSRWLEADASNVQLARVPVAEPGQPGATALVLASLVIAAAVWPIGLQAIEQRMETSSGVRMQPLPSVGEWRAIDSELTSWTPVINKPSSVVHQTFSDGHSSVGIHIAYFRHQSRAQKLVSSTNILAEATLAHGALWAVESKRPATLVAGAQRFEAIETQLIGAQGSQALLAESWYWIDGRSTGNQYLAKFYTFLARLRGRDDGAIVIVYAKEPSARSAIEAFTENAIPTVLTRTLGRIDEP